MYEIELKAHVKNHGTVSERLDLFAKYIGKTEKHDTYWYLKSPGGEKNAHGNPNVRIRKETTNAGTAILLTYKHKEKIENNCGTTFELNDEKECSLSDAIPLETFLSDIGFYPAIQKHKTVYDWEVNTVYGKALFELCTVPPLGDFLEIEILSDSNETDIVAGIRTELEKLLIKCGIPLSEIEPRYYTDMIAEAECKNISR